VPKGPEGRRWANRIELPAERDTHFELPSADGRNVRDSDGTVVFTIAPILTGGSKRTVDFALKHKKPWLHIYPGHYDAAQSLMRFVSEHHIKTLNIAGSRASKEPQIAAFVKQVLDEAFYPRPDCWLGRPGEG
jgi:Circularly permutated YpsA SLOG family